MSNFKLLSARRKSGNVPTMQKVKMSAAQKQWAAQGICIQCGEGKASATSYLCTQCQAGDSQEEIRKEIEKLRHEILKR